MKHLITFLLCLFSLITFAQNTNDTTKYFKSYDYGFSYRRLQAREAFIMPTDTVINKLGAVSLNGNIFLGNGIKWTSIGGGGSSTDTTSLSNRINLKLNIADTSSMLSKYLRKTDTASLSNRIEQRIDSIRRSGDSIFVRKNGVFVFQYKDSVGGDFWKTSGTTDLTGNVNIQSDSRILFKGINNELPRFQINADSLIFVNSGNGYTYLSGLTTTTDTSTYKPLGIDGTGKLAPLTSWASGGGGDFWKTSGTTILGVADTIVSDNGSLIFIGGAEDMARFSVQANDIDLTTSGGAVGISMSGLDALTDTSTYKPLMISSSGVLKKSTSWVSGGGVAVDTIFRTLGKDSIFYKKYGITYAIKDSVGGGAFLPLSGGTLTGNLNGTTATFSSGGSSNTFNINHSSGSGHALEITKAGNGEGIIVNKTSGSGNAVTITGTLNATTLVKNGGTSTQFLKANGSVDSTTYVSDTTALQRKSIPSYTFLANNTPSTANAQALPFKDTSGIYTESPTFNGTAPTSSSHTYRWTRIGKMITLNIALVYSVAGTSNSNILVPLPTDCPSPIEPTGLTGNSTFIYPVNLKIFASFTALANLSERASFRKNSAGNGFEISASFTGTSSVGALITLIYYTN